MFEDKSIKKDDVIESGIPEGVTREQWELANQRADESIACFVELSQALLKESGIYGRMTGSSISEGVVESVAAYLLYKASRFKNPAETPFSALASRGIDQDILDFATSVGIPEAWETLLPFLERYDSAVFNIVPKWRDVNSPNITPDGIIKLAVNLLDVSDGESFCDLCCGSGSVTEAISEYTPLAKAIGYDLNLGRIAWAKVRAEGEEEGPSYEKKDVFDLALQEEGVPKYDKIFSNYPFGMKLRNLEAGQRYLDLVKERIPSISRATSSDWLYNMLMIEMLEDGGKAIGIMTNGSTWNTIDAPIRKYFVENGLIECVIALPGKLFHSTSIPTSLIVLSHGNKGVRLVDATDQFLPGRRVNELSGDNIDYILDAVDEDGNNSVFVSTEELRENNYVLNLSRYRLAGQSIDNGVELETVIKRISRGAPLNAKKLDELASSAPTSMQYLMLANIQSGIIDTNLPYLSRIDKRDEKYCLKDRCLILSKNGNPYKIAVAEVHDGQKILANGNLYIIEVDEEKADPYYLAAFFSSEQGTAALKSITVGSTIPNVGVEQLKKLLIPLPDLETQREVGIRYQTVKDEIKMLQLKLEKAKDRMMHVFEEEGGSLC